MLPQDIIVSCIILYQTKKKYFKFYDLIKKDLETKIEDIPKHKKLRAYWDDGSIYTCTFIGEKKTFNYTVSFKKNFN